MVQIDELITRIRHEAARRSASAAPAPEVPLDERIEAVLARAEQRALPRTELPDKLQHDWKRLLAIPARLFLKALEVTFRDQRVVNLLVIEAGRHLNSLGEAREAAQRQALEGLKAHLVGLDGRVEAATENLARQTLELHEIGQGLARLEQALSAESHLREAALTDGRQLIDLLATRVNDVTRRVDAAAERFARGQSFVTTELTLQRQLLSRGGAAPSAPCPQSTPDDLALQSFYLALEDEFRGDRAAIKSRLSAYLPLLAEAGVKDGKFLDLGCGRGEWLELLRDHGFQAEGVDQNDVLLTQCRALDLMVHQDDALRYLRSLPDGELACVSGFHLVEHLPFPVLLAMLDEVVRVLRPGGLAVFETPNPENLLVGACNFYYDPTHRHPLPPLLMRFVLANRGFDDARIWRLVTRKDVTILSPEEDHAGGHQRWEDFFGPQDYAVVGRRP